LISLLLLILGTVALTYNGKKWTYLVENNKLEVNAEGNIFDILGQKIGRTNSQNDDLHEVTSGNTIANYMSRMRSLTMSNQADKVRSGSLGASRELSENNSKSKYTFGKTQRSDDEKSVKSTKSGAIDENIEKKEKKEKKHKKHKKEKRSKKEKIIADDAKTKNADIVMQILPVGAENDNVSVHSEIRKSDEDSEDSDSEDSERSEVVDD